MAVDPLLNGAILLIQGGDLEHKGVQIAETYTDYSPGYPGGSRVVPNRIYALGPPRLDAPGAQVLSDRIRFAGARGVAAPPEWFGVYTGSFAVDSPYTVFEVCVEIEEWVQGGPIFAIAGWNDPMIEVKMGATPGEVVVSCYTKYYAPRETVWNVGTVGSLLFAFRLDPGFNFFSEATYSLTATSSEGPSFGLASQYNDNTSKGGLFSIAGLNGSWTPDPTLAMTVNPSYVAQRGYPSFPTPQRVTIQFKELPGGAVGWLPTYGIVTSGTVSITATKASVGSLNYSFTCPSTTISSISTAVAHGLAQLIGGTSSVDGLGQGVVTYYHTSVLDSDWSFSIDAALQVSGSPAYTFRGILGVVSVAGEYGLSPGLATTITRTFIINPAVLADNPVAVGLTVSGDFNGTSVARPAGTLAELVDVVADWAAATGLTVSWISQSSEVHTLTVTGIGWFTVDVTIAGIPVSTPVGIVDLLGVRITADRFREPAFPPWPTSSIPTTGAYVPLSNDIWLSINAENGFVDNSIYHHALLTNVSDYVVEGVGSRTGDTYMVSTHPYARTDYAANLRELDNAPGITIEFDIYAPGGQSGLFLSSNGLTYLEYHDSGVPGMVEVTASGWIPPDGAAPFVSFPVATWTHIAFCSTWGGGGVWRSFVNGVEHSTDDANTVASYPSASYSTVEGGLAVFGSRYRADIPSGTGLRLDNVVITKAVKYTTTFTPPGVAPTDEADPTLLLLHFDEPGSANSVPALDSSNYNHDVLIAAGSQTIAGNFGNAFNMAWTNASVYDQLEMFKLGREWTIEFFIRWDGGTPQTNEVILHFADGATWNNGWVVVMSSNHQPFLYNNAASYLSGFALPGDTSWHHVAFVADGADTVSSCTVYVDGVFAGTSAQQALSGPAIPSTLNVGTDGVNGIYTSTCRSIDELRISRVARYTAAFTPPAAPFTTTLGGVVDNTQLLMHFDETTGLTYLDSSTANRTMTIAGGTAASTTAAGKFSAGFVPQDATRLYVTSGAGEGVILTDPFTIEFFLKSSAPPPGTHAVLLYQVDAGNTGVGFELLYSDTNNGALQLLLDGNSVILTPPIIAPNSGVWGHVAVVLNNGNLYIYSGGNYVTHGPITWSSASWVNQRLYIGGGHDAQAEPMGANNALQMDELRISNVARYTGGFGETYVVPTAPFGSEIPAASGDVQGAGNNYLAELETTGAGNEQSSAPNPYGSSASTLEDFYADQSLVIDNNSVNGTSVRSLAAFTNTGNWVAAVPTEMVSPDQTLEDFTSDSAGVASTPIEVIVPEQVLEDMTADALGMFLEPSRGSADVLLAEFTSTGAGETQASPTARVNVTMSMPTVYASGSLKTTDVAYVTMPKPVVASYGHGTAATTMPKAVVAVTGTVVNIARVAAEMPMPTASATGRVAGSSTIQVTMPLAEMVGYGGGMVSATIDGFTTTFSINQGTAGQITAEMPMVVVEATGFTTNTGQIEAIMPMLVPNEGGRITAVLPMVRVVATGFAVVAVTNEAYVLNLAKPLDDNPRNNFESKNDQMTRYTNFPFTQVVRYLDSYYGVAADGLYLLEGTTDNGAPLAWSFSTCVTDFGNVEKKTVASVYLGGQAGPDVDFIIKSGETPDQVHEYVTAATTVKRNYRQKFGKGRRTRYWALGLAGEGELALDMLEFEVGTMARRI